MAYAPRILAFAGSLRVASFNKHLLQVAAAAATAEGAQVTTIDLRDYPLPVFDQDIETEHGLPENARRLKALMLEHQGLLIASPEYNSSLSAALKNCIDWVSRPLPGEGALACYVDKTAAIMSASPGALGGLRGLVHLRSILSNIRVLVLPEQVAVPRANEAFSNGKLKDAAQQASVENLGLKLTRVLRKLHAS